MIRDLSIVIRAPRTVARDLRNGAWAIVPAPRRFLLLRLENRFSLYFHWFAKFLNPGLLRFELRGRQCCNAVRKRTE